MSNPIYLLLENGRVFAGTGFGAPPPVGGTVGELVFCTAMEGYMETLTDPSYCGQIAVQTFPLIGNYGAIEADTESDGCKMRGYVVREICDTPSNFRSEGTLGDWMKQKGVVGICGVDTRELTKLIRDGGTQNALICTDPETADCSLLQTYRVHGAVAECGTGRGVYAPDGADCGLRVTLIDYGTKRRMIRALTDRGCTVTVLPAGSSAQEVAATAPDGLLLSNGPGDPSENTDCIKTLRSLLGRYPIFGICLGHQLLALAAGAATEKLKYGHRGGNHPVREQSGGRVYITSQNHGYAVVSDSLPAFAKQSFVNVNDGSCEGVEYPEQAAFSVQFHPEAHGGPNDTGFLFDRFVRMMREHKGRA